MAEWHVGKWRSRLMKPLAGRRPYAAAEGLTGTENLFPGTSEDPILHALLRLPWTEVHASKGDGSNIPFFQRALDIQEYAESFCKIASPGIAFYRGTSIDGLAIEGVDVGGIVVKVPNIVLFGTADEAPLSFPKIMELVKRHGSVALEVDHLLQHANMGGTVFYQKGVVVLPRAPDLIELGELMVEHPGLELTRAGMIQGWFYRVGGDGLWVRQPDTRECTCGSDHPHLRHISALHIAEAFLSDPEAFK